MARTTKQTEAVLTAVVAHTAILHNGKRYDVGEEISLTEAEYHRLAVYVTLKDAKALEKAKAEAEAIAQALVEQAKAEAEANAKEAEAEANAKEAEAEANAKEAEATEKTDKKEK
ncbi:hypothetical protein P9057_06640 [Gallibacterium anatis]|uniref:DUF7210 family protein n=1 Tax=Gallibacterium anatis TaxID=750 RepID=UPI003006922D